MCDVRQLAWRPIRPGGQQLLTVDLRMGGGSGNRGSEEVWKKRDKKNHANNFAPHSPFPVISDKNMLILWVWSYSQQVVRPIPAQRQLLGLKQKMELQVGMHKQFPSARSNAHKEDWHFVKVTQSEDSLGWWCRRSHPGPVTVEALTFRLTMQSPGPPPHGPPLCPLPLRLWSLSLLGWTAESPPLLSLTSSHLDSSSWLNLKCYHLSFIYFLSPPY